MPEELAAPFMSIRLTIYHGGTVDELRALNYAENIDQHKRKQHTELDNIWAVREWMASMVAFPELDATKALDVVKYAYALTDLRNREIPKWLRSLLKKGGHANTLQGRIRALAPLNHTVLQGSGALCVHPRMPRYQDVALRVRLLKGFDLAVGAFAAFVCCRAGRG